MDLSLRRTMLFIPGNNPAMLQNGGVFGADSIILDLEDAVAPTEKDAARLVSNPYFPEALKSRTYALPIRVRILHNQENIFIQKIKNYVAENSRYR